MTEQIVERVPSPKEVEILAAAKELANIERTPEQDAELIALAGQLRDEMRVEERPQDRLQEHILPPWQLPVISESRMDTICTMCKGFCCEMFFLKFQTDEALLAFRETAIKEKQASEADFNFMAENFYRLKEIPSGNGGRTYAFSCKQFDAGKGVCKSDETRPHLCRIFRCDPVQQGFIPHHRSTEHNGPTIEGRP